MAHLLQITMSWDEDAGLLALPNSEEVSKHRGATGTQSGHYEKSAAWFIFLGGLRIQAEIME